MRSLPAPVTTPARTLTTGVYGRPVTERRTALVELDAMTAVSTVEPDALLLELVATPEGRADPYPRYAALRARRPCTGARSASGR